MPKNDDLAKTTAQTTDEQDPGIVKPAGRSADETSPAKPAAPPAEATRGCG